MATLQSLMHKNAAPEGWCGFLDALRHKDKTALDKMNAVSIQKASNQTETSGILGGYVVPPEFSLAIATTYEENAFFYPRATVVPMHSREISLPVPAVGAQTAGTAPWFGGMLFSWGTGGTGTLVQTNPTFAQLSLPAWSLIGTITVSQDWAQDAGPGGDEFLFNMFARGSAYYEEYAFLRGTGTTAGNPQGQPLGVLSAPGTVFATRAIPSQISSVELDNMAGSMTPLGWTKAIWACSPTAFKRIAGVTGFITNQAGLDTIGISAAGSLFGRPLFVTDKLPPLGTAGDVIFIDPTQYVVGDRAELIVQAADETNFTANQIVYRVWRRVGGAPIYSSSITVTDGATVVSPFVALAA